jgi:Ca2+-binding RTX toxin-like protein
VTIMNGTSASETIKGTSSADTISGKTGNDTLYGLSGNDTLLGNEGNDALIGGGGEDTLVGGAGADTFRYLRFADSTGSNVDLIQDFSASQGDKVDLTALGVASLESAYKPSFSSLQAVFSYDSTTDVTTLSYYQGSSTPVFQLEFTGHVTYSSAAFPGISKPINGTGGDDDLSADVGGSIINGGTGNDFIFGDFNGAVDYLYGDAGDDFISADGHDHIFGGAGSDFIIVDNVDELSGEIDGGDGSDLLMLQLGDEGILNATTGELVDPSGRVLFTFTGIESFQTGGITTFIGSDAAEQVTAGADHIFIQDDVTIVGNGGADRIFSGEGNDTLSGGAGDDIIDGNVGEDTAVFSGNHTDYIITVDASYLLDPFFATATVEQVGGVGDGIDTLTNIEFLQFADGTFAITDFLPPSPAPTAGDDIIVGTANADTIDLLGGNDTYLGLGGNDKILGGEGSDDIRGGDGNDQISAGAGSDIVSGDAGNDAINGNGGADWLLGGAGGDTIHGGQDGDSLFGEDGDDFLFGDAGDDRLDGGTGNDHIDGGGGFDTVGLSGFFDEFTIAAGTGGSIILTATSPSVSSGQDTLVGIERIEFFDGYYDVATSTFIPDFIV